jgi:putative spermidine/putrescine transport system permease protein
MKSQRRFANFLGKFFIFLLVGGLAAAPVALLVPWSFAEGWRFPALLPSGYGLRAWRYALSPSAGVADALARSALIATGVTTLALAVATPAARALAFYDFRGKKFLFFLLLLPLLSPSFVMAVSGHALFLRYGLTDSWFGVGLSHLIPTVPYATLTLVGGFSKLDRDLEAQARTLGASLLSVWRYVTVPAIAPALAVAASFAFLISWGQYLTTLLIGGGGVITLPMLLVAFQRGGDEAVTAALTLIFIAPTPLAFLAAAKSLTTRTAR